MQEGSSYTNQAGQECGEVSPKMKQVPLNGKKTQVQTGKTKVRKKRATKKKSGGYSVNSSAV